jgi:hypothetical protein
VNDLDISVGDKVTIGLGTHDMEVQAWITFPATGVTHEIDPQRTSATITQYREMKTPVRHFERLMVLSVRNPKHLNGTVVEIMESCWGGEMVLVDLGNRKRWFNAYLLNCPPLHSKVTTAA